MFGTRSMLWCVGDRAPRVIDGARKDSHVLFTRRNEWIPAARRNSALAASQPRRIFASRVISTGFDIIFRRKQRRAIGKPANVIALAVTSRRFLCGAAAPDENIFPTNCPKKFWLETFQRFSEFFWIFFFSSKFLCRLINISAIFSTKSPAVTLCRRNSEDFCDFATS